MTTTEPELITIIEGPTPEFNFTPQEWVQSLYEGTEERVVATCQLRTANGKDILERCRQAWKEYRLVKLDFPNDMRERQQLDVVSLRLTEVDEGPVLNLWISIPSTYLHDDDRFNNDDDLDDLDDLDDGSVPF